MAGNPRLLLGQLRAFCGGLKANVVQTERVLADISIGLERISAVQWGLRSLSVVSPRPIRHFSHQLGKTYT